MYKKENLTRLKRIWGVLIAAACAQLTLSVGGAAEPKLGEEPPPLGLESVLQAPSGAQASWKALKGKVVVLEFWATWCGPCNAAIPHLNELADKFKDEPIQFITVTSEDEKVVAPFLRKKPMHAWIGLDTDKSMFNDYGITGIPHTVVVDQKGVIAAITHPTFLTEELLKDLLAGKKIAFAQPTISKPEREALFQVVIRPSGGGASKSISNRGSLEVSSATVLDILSSSYGINPSRIVADSALPEGRFDFTIKIPGVGNEVLKTWLRRAVESTFGLTVRPETREMDAFVLKAGQLSEHLAPTVSPGVASMSSGGGSLNCEGQSMRSLASSLEDILAKPVFDETGLTNSYDFQLLWAEKTSGETDPVELTQALREQLGLELAPAKRAVELLEVTAANLRADRSKH
jgi:uncharacterized protein (TIGR03435 family)